MTKHLILGTAGHIDHGKTTLISALTGIDTDRLPEEKQRGITIELGFAHLTLSDDTEVGIVDVPGHEKFVHHMVAGVGGMDMVALVIAADEGVMPQTREHLAICQLLGVQKGFVALTKTDMVEDDWLELVLEDIQEYLKGSFLENSPIVPVSAIKGTGIQDIIQTIEEIALNIEPRQAAGPFRLPVDRVFTIRGFGTVITGTVASGQIRKSDTVTLLPGNIACKIRGLQNHGQDVDSVSAGQRAAVNLQGTDKSLISRGMTLARPDSIEQSYMLDGTFKYLDSNSKALKNRTRIRFHTGTSEILGRIILLDRDIIEPGQTTDVQLRLTEPASCLPGDRYIIRSYSPVMTIGGGQILDAAPAKHKRFRTETKRHVQQLASHQPEERLNAWLLASGIKGMTVPMIQRCFPDPDIDVDHLLKTLLDSQQAFMSGTQEKRYINAEILSKLQDRIVDIIKSYHQRYPLRRGLNKEALQSLMKPQPDLETLVFAVEQLINNGVLTQKQSILSIHDFSPSLSPEQQTIYQKIIKLTVQGGFSGITSKELEKQSGADSSLFKQLVQFALDEGKVVRLPGGLILQAECMSPLKKIIMDLCQNKGSFTAGEFRDAAEISRKQAIPLLEYFDSIGLTRRKGDQRILRSDQ